MTEPGWTRAAAAGLTFRAATDADLPFLAQVYASTRTEELALVPWSDAQKAAFLDMQFRAQHVDYRKNSANAEWLVILRGGEAIGRIYLERGERQHGIIDITFLPGHRGRGYGTALLQDLIDEAAAARRAVSIYVEKHNPARRLYARLGFRQIDGHGLYDRFEVGPGA